VSVRVRFVLVVVGVLLLSGCMTEGGTEGGAEAQPSASTGASKGASVSPEPSTPTPSPTPSPSKSTERPTSPRDPSTLDRSELRRAALRADADARIQRVPAKQWRRIVATGAWRAGCPVGRAGLRRVAVNHFTFDGDVRRGVLVVNRDVARSISRIFTRLFEAGYPIRKMVPVEEYDGDAKASLEDGNTSAFNCRRPDQINAPPMKSPHANGRAIDINPQENPWRDLRCKCWVPNRENRARTPGLGVIVKGGLVWRTFRAEGWIWQNIDVPDYMHFDTGYPSRPYRGPEANKRRQAGQWAGKTS